MKRLILLTILVGTGAVVANRHVPDQQQQGRQITVPQGFVAEEVYPSAQVGSVVAIVFDSRGNLVIGRQNQPIVTLFDDNKDGRYDREVIFHENARHSQGITFDGNDMIFDGQGPEGVGLYRVVDDNGDSRGERIELIELAWGNIGDHGPHQPFWGPDGYLYWDQGNGSGIFEAYLPNSPLREWDEGTLNGRVDPRGHASTWRAPGGIFLRTNIASRGVTGQSVQTPGNTEWELFAGGFRNQYDASFNWIGELFTFDSDMEWDLNLPHYKGTSSVHVIPGGDHAWRSGSMNHPWYYIDHLPPMADMGRGSPTGVTVLMTYNYPAEYWDMLLQSDWSRGRVIGGRLTKNGATYSQTASNVLYGEPLNVADLEVGPDGNLYFSLGGGGGSGGLYRLVYRGNDAMQKPAATTPIAQVLTAINPRSPFSREQARAVKAQMGERNWQTQLTATLRNANAPALQRVRALELLQVFGPAPDEPLLTSLRADASWEVRAMSAYYLGMKTTPTARTALVALTKDADPFVQRRALEGLIRTGLNPMSDPGFDPATEIVPLLSSPDRFVRYQARAVLQQTRRTLWESQAMALSGPAGVEGLMAVVQTLDNPRIVETTRMLARGYQLLQATPTSGPELLPIIRVIQRAALESVGVTGHAITAANPIRPTLAPLGPDGLVSTAPQGQGGGGGAAQGAQTQTNAWILIGENLLARFPAADTSVSREIARTVAYMGTAGALEKISLELEKPGNTRSQQIFYAEQLSYMPQGWTEPIATRVASWLERTYREQWRGGASYAGYINYIRQAMLDYIPASQYTQISQRLEQSMQAAMPTVAAAVAGGGQVTSPLADQEVFEDLVFRPNVLAASPAGGVSAYQRAGCAGCHTFGPIGIGFGPDLTTVGQRFGRADLVRAIIFPHEAVSDLYPTDEITRRNGEKVTGIVRESGNNLVVGVAGNAEITIPLTDVQTRIRTNRSAMPEGLLASIDQNSQRALVAMLLAGTTSIPDSALARVNAGN